MSNTQTLEPADRHAGHGSTFTAQVADESFEFHEVRFDDRKVTGAQIAAAAGKHPVEEYLVLQQLASFELETILPSELVDVTTPARFFVIKGSGTDQFFVDGLSLEWPIKKITGMTVLRLVGKDDEDVELILEREDTADQAIDDDEEVVIGKEGVERFKTRPVHVPILIFVDGEDYEAPRPRMTPNEIIREAASKDPTTHYLVRITKHGKVSYQGKGDKPIRLRKGMRFQVISTGPTPVSDPRMRTGVDAFIAGLKQLGYDTKPLAGHADHITFQYVVESGVYAGRTVRHGLVIPADFPITPPSGPYVTPEIHPINSDGEHPKGRVHKDQARVFDGPTGASWQYWSRPFPGWPESKRSVAAYMSHIWKLWDSQ